MWYTIMRPFPTFFGCELIRANEQLSLRSDAVRFFVSYAVERFVGAKCKLVVKRDENVYRMLGRFAVFVDCIDSPDRVGTSFRLLSVKLTC